MSTDMPPVRIHFSRPFPIETRTLTSEEEYAIVEVLKVEYGIDENGDDFDITFYLTGIKSFSVSDDDQECFIEWTLKPYGSENAAILCSGKTGTGSIEMGERFEERESIVKKVPEGDYLFEILYV